MCIVVPGLAIAVLDLQVSYISNMKGIVSRDLVTHICSLISFTPEPLIHQGVNRKIVCVNSAGSDSGS